MATGKKGLTARGKAMRRCTNKRGISEQPAGSNTDRRLDGIRAWQMALGAWLVGLAWCGVSAADKLLAGGVRGVTYRLASVALIEEDAKNGRGPFRDWLAPSVKNLARVLRGDLVVLFGYGVHVGVVRGFKYVRGLGWVVITEEGNTSPPAGSGSQANGGWQGRRERLLRDCRGFARVDYPGGAPRARRAVAASAMIAKTLVRSVQGVAVGSPHVEERGLLPGSDTVLLDQIALRKRQGAATAEEKALWDELIPF